MMYVKIGLVIAIFLGGWMVKGWQVDSKHKAAIESMIETHNEQRVKDFAKFEKDVKAAEKTKIIFKTVKAEIRNVPDTPDDECTVDISYKRVWNRAVEAIGESLTNSLHGSLRATLVHDNREYELQSGSKGSFDFARGRYGDTSEMR